MDIWIHTNEETEEVEFEIHHPWMGRLIWTLPEIAATQFMELRRRDMFQQEIDIVQPHLADMMFITTAALLDDGTQTPCGPVSTFIHRAVNHDMVEEARRFLREKIPLEA